MGPLTSYISKVKTLLYKVKITPVYPFTRLLEVHQDGVMASELQGNLPSRDADTFTQTLVSKKKVSNWIECLQH